MSNNLDKEIITPLKIINKAFYSSLSGMIAMGSQVSLLMWMRTSVNYQYRNGGTIKNTFKSLYREGGLLRFYRGYSMAMLQAPLSRFGDIASYSITKQYGEHYDLSLPLQTGISTMATCMWRFVLMPIDTSKTMMQVHGNTGLSTLSNKIKTHGIGSLYQGYTGTLGATMMGYYPWFLTFGYLDKNIPKGESYILDLCRNASIGFSASLASDTISNSARVLKTIKQTDSSQKSYLQHARSVGFSDLVTRGLGLKIVSNGLQSAMFTVIWKYLDNILKHKSEN